MKKKTCLDKHPEKFYQDMGPLTLLSYLTDVELGRLKKLQQDMIGHGCDNDHITLLNKQISALENQRTQCLRWMAKAIQVVSWS